MYIGDDSFTHAIAGKLQGKHGDDDAHVRCNVDHKDVLCLSKQNVKYN